MYIMITRKQAWDEVNELIKNRNLVKHCLAVECAMRAYADYFKVDDSEKEKWAVAGLIHDADWEAFPDEHPGVIVKWLRDNKAGADIINAVEAHGWDPSTGSGQDSGIEVADSAKRFVEPRSLMAKTLRACDELTGLIVAVALVKDRKLAKVTVESVLNKWKKKEFARGVKREDIERGAEEIGVPLEKHIEIVLGAMQEKAKVLGL
jgi:predicted hydrolase (HD superfamily)